MAVCGSRTGSRFCFRKCLSVRRMLWRLLNGRLFRRGVRTLLSDGALHPEHEYNERDLEHGKHEEGVEIGERGGLLLAQVVE